MEQKSDQRFLNYFISTALQFEERLLRRTEQSPEEIEKNAEYIYKMVNILVQKANQHREKVKALLLSDGQINLRDCNLPFHDCLFTGRGLVCKRDRNHVFCKEHSLVKCPICGGDLENE